MRICPRCTREMVHLVCPDDGFKTVELSRVRPDERDPLIGCLFEGRYQIESLIGRGGFGSVYRAVQLGMGRPVAIKILGQSQLNDPVHFARLEQEACAAGALNHPNILAIYDIGTHDGTPYIVSELLEGETLREVLEDGPLTHRKVTDYAIQISRGLAAAHEKGIIHRDLKPENLFVTRVLIQSLLLHLRPVLT